MHIGLVMTRGLFRVLGSQTFRSWFQPSQLRSRVHCTACRCKSSYSTVQREQQKTPTLLLLLVGYIMPTKPRRRGQKVDKGIDAAYLSNTY